MKIWIKLIKYHFMLYLRTNKYIVPGVVFFVFVYSTYLEEQRQFVGNITGTALFAGIVMMWITYSYFDSEDIVMERILLCKIKHNKFQYYGSKLLFLWVIGVILSLFASFYPFIANVVNHFTLFTRSLGVNDFTGAFLMHNTNATVAIATTYVFQPRNMKNRKFAVMLMILVAVVSLCKQSIFESVSVIRYLSYVFPPLLEIATVFQGCDYFNAIGIFKVLSYGIVYSSIVMVLGLYIVEQKGFE